MSLMLPLMALVLMLGSIVLVAAVANAVTRRPPQLPPARATPPPEPDPAVVRVKQLAWDHRDLDPPLADELIAFLNAHEVDRDQRAVRNEIAEIAWRHRETCPDLSTLVIDLVRRPR